MSNASFWPKKSTHIFILIYITQNHGNKRIKTAKTLLNSFPWNKEKTVQRTQKTSKIIT